MCFFENRKTKCKLGVFNVSIYVELASYPSGSRGRFAKPLFTGSNPVDASIYSARVVKLVDTRDLKSLARIGHVGSSPTPGTFFNN